MAFHEVIAPTSSIKVAIREEALSHFSRPLVINEFSYIFIAIILFIIRFKASNTMLDHNRLRRYLILLLLVCYRPILDHRPRTLHPDLPIIMVAIFVLENIENITILDCLLPVIKVLHR